MLAEAKERVTAADARESGGRSGGMSGGSGGREGEGGEDAMSG
jgi:hypothetical protein